MYPARDISWEATGNIPPNRLMNGDWAAGDNKAKLCAAGELSIGCSGWGTRNAPGTPGDDGFLAVSGYTVPIMGPGQIGWVQIADDVTRGNELVATTGGCATNANTTANSTQPIAGRALANGTANDIIPYWINPYWKTTP